MKAIVYGRVTTVQQAQQGTNVDTQRAKIEQAADARGWTLVD
jgi:DNA invertase Pin-like site-specific DNA recombinase